MRIRLLALKGLTCIHIYKHSLKESVCNSRTFFKLNGHYFAMAASLDRIGSRYRLCPECKFYYDENKSRKNK